METLSLNKAFKNPSKIHNKLINHLQQILPVFIVQDMVHNMDLFTEQIQGYLKELRKEKLEKVEND